MRIGRHWQNVSKAPANIKRQDDIDLKYVLVQLYREVINRALSKARTQDPTAMAKL